MYVIDQMVAGMVLGAVIVALAVLPAIVLVSVYERGGSALLWIAAAALALLFSYPAGLPGLLNHGDWQEALFQGFSTLLPPLTAAAALVGGIGGLSFWRRTLGAASVGVLTAALPVMAILVSSGSWQERTMPAAAIALLSFTIVRHLWQRRIISRRSRLDTAA